ncbi:formylglycine-generating enzyme family protein [Chamaesiphon sp. VAR_48_metabat_135_sub]|uniref:formylglycine-generating enzyme family protein n=1 Tax=Chamaesiphon sp. VAR_48_metabat_135_sub TaxID=2964699 RepID=UPI00286A3A1C|nr:formylglycine-generating enzyme family protein [Chamaesiphon sp. VAR_48_metabat_135_sub]
MSELQPSNTDAILGGQNPVPIDAAVLGGVPGTKQKLAHEFGTIHELSTFETVTVNKSGEITSRTNKQAFYYTEKLGNGIMLDMVYISAGSFIMGSSDKDKNSLAREKPQHLVSVPAFHMGKYPITQEQYQAIMGSNPSYIKGDGKLPVESVIWDNVQVFCEKLSQQTQKKYRLPSESQWEYACRAGTTTPFHYGETITTDIANFDGTFSALDISTKIYRSKTTIVGSFPANHFGLCDMHGNVWEWCEDCWHENYQGAPVDGNAWNNDCWHETYQESFHWNDRRVYVVRGGGCHDIPNNCKSAFRNGLVASTPLTTGFRVVS